MLCDVTAEELSTEPTHKAALSVTLIVVDRVMGPNHPLYCPRSPIGRGIGLKIHVLWVRIPPRVPSTHFFFFMFNSAPKRVLTELHKKRISESMTGENNPNYGKSPSEETRMKMSESTKGENCLLYTSPSPRDS